MAFKHTTILDLATLENTSRPIFLLGSNTVWFDSLKFPGLMARISKVLQEQNGLVFKGPKKLGFRDKNCLYLALHVPGTASDGFEPLDSAGTPATAADENIGPEIWHGLHLTKNFSKLCTFMKTVNF